VSEPDSVGYVARVLIDPEKCGFLFGSDEPPVAFDEIESIDELDDFDSIDDLLGLEPEDPEPALTSVLRMVLARQVIADAPAQVWATARRLLAQGLDREDVLRQMLVVLATELRRALDDSLSTSGRSRTRDAPDDGDPDGDDPDGDDRGRGPGSGRATGYDEQRYERALTRLPLPAPQRIREAIDLIAAEHRGAVAAELVERALERLGRETDDEVAAFVVERTIAEGLEVGALVELRDERIAHPRSLTEGIVLTHRVTEAELALGILSCIGSDLTGFVWRDDVRLAPASSSDGAHDENSDDSGAIDATELALEISSLEAGHLAWEGPPGWLEHLHVGDLIAVRVGGDGEVSIEVLESVTGPKRDPAGDAGIDGRTDDQLVARLGARCRDDSEEAQLPTGLDELVLALLLDDPSTFAEPRPPIVELCELAGLEVRCGHAAPASEAWMWEALAYRQRHERIIEAFDDSDDAEEAMDALDLLEDPQASPAHLRDLLDVFADGGPFCPTVVDELLDVDLAHGDVSKARAAAARLVAAARRPEQVALAHLVAALIAERAGDVLDAEHHLDLGVDSGAAFDPLLDRRAWYASDRGDAAAALRWWAMAPPVVDREIEIARRFAPPTKLRLGRNDPCWCGSGRKYKTCHLGRIESPPLVERVEWLWQKATAYLIRRGGAAHRTLHGLGVVHRLDTRNLALLDDLDDHDLVELIADPIAVDLTLVEGRWFRRFLAERGALLPDDERELAASWVDIVRSVYALVRLGDDGTVTVRDLRTDAQIEALGPDLAGSWRPGELLCGRAVPDGRSHQFVGVGFAVPADAAADILELCDRRATQALVVHATAVGS
jgi:SEC-C motif